MRVTIDPLEIVGSGISFGVGACGSSRTFGSYYLADVKPVEQKRHKPGEIILLLREFNSGSLSQESYRRDLRFRDSNDLESWVEASDWTMISESLLAENFSEVTWIPIDVGGRQFVRGRASR